MGWEAIEQYLKEVEREASHSVDQEVPQMLVDCLEVIQGDPDHQTTEFYTDELNFQKSPIAPITGEPVYQPVEKPEICDLDKTNESTTLLGFDPTVQYLDQLESVKMDTDFPTSFQRRFNTQDQFWTEALNVCFQDVEDTCRCLGISRDPLQWSCGEVQQWIVWQCRQFNVPEPNMDYFFITGAELCSFSEEEFRMYARNAGPTLYARLEVWRSVVEQTTSQIYTCTTLPVPVSPARSGSSGSLSPAPSSFSDSGYQSETPSNQTQSTDDEDRLPEEPVHHHRQTIQLWQFLKLLLLDGGYTDCIRWVDRSRGIFKIENSTRVARLWGKRKNRPAMNYDKLSRSIRQYYKKNIIKKPEHSKRLVYQFCHM